MRMEDLEREQRKAECLEKIKTNLSHNALRQTVAGEYYEEKREIMNRLLRDILEGNEDRVLIVSNASFDWKWNMSQTETENLSRRIDITGIAEISKYSLDDYALLMLNDLSDENRLKMMKVLDGKAVKTISWFLLIDLFQDKRNIDLFIHHHITDALFVIETKSIPDIRDIHLADYEEILWLKNKISEYEKQAEKENKIIKEQNIKLTEQHKKLDSEILVAKEKEEKNKKHPVTEHYSFVVGDGFPFFGKKSKVRELQEKQQELQKQLRENEAALARKDEQIAFMQSLLQKIGIPLDLLMKSFEEIQLLREELGERLLSSDESVREAALKQLQDKAAEIIEQLTAKTITAENKAFYEASLRNALSDDVWNRLDPRSKSFLITAKSNFDSMSRMQDRDTFDYSGVCLLMTKALEVETANRFYSLYKSYLGRKYREIHKWPFAIRKWEAGEVTNTVIDENDFTLGSVVPFAGLKRIYDEDGIQIDLEWSSRYNKREFLEFAADRLFRTTDMDYVENEIMNDSIFIETVRLDYRNPSAHRKELDIVSARKCFDYMVDIQHMLKKMLEPMAV